METHSQPSTFTTMNPARSLYLRNPLLLPEITSHHTHHLNRNLLNSVRGAEKIFSGVYVHTHTFCVLTSSHPCFLSIPLERTSKHTARRYLMMMQSMIYWHSRPTPTPTHLSRHTADHNLCPLRHYHITRTLTVHQSSIAPWHHHFPRLLNHLRKHAWLSFNRSRTSLERPVMPLRIFYHIL